MILYRAGTHAGHTGIYKWRCVRGCVSWFYDGLGVKRKCAWMCTVSCGVFFGAYIVDFGYANFQQKFHRSIVHGATAPCSPDYFKYSLIVLCVKSVLEQNSQSCANIDYQYWSTKSESVHLLAICLPLIHPSTFIYPSFCSFICLSVLPFLPSIHLPSHSFIYPVISLN